MEEDSPGLGLKAPDGFCGQSPQHVPRLGSGQQHAAQCGWGRGAERGAAPEHPLRATSAAFTHHRPGRRVLYHLHLSEDQPEAWSRERTAQSHPAGLGLTVGCPAPGWARCAERYLGAGGRGEGEAPRAWIRTRHSVFSHFILASTQELGTIVRFWTAQSSFGEPALFHCTLTF